jgi:hypothetical protein
VKTADCRRCGAKILFATDHKKRRVPLDAKPQPGVGYVLAKADSDGGLPAIVGRNDHPQVEAYRRHKCRH